MAQKQIKQLNEATEVLKDDLLIIQQAADDDTLKITRQNFEGGGWIDTGGTHSVSTGYNSGNRSFEIDTSTDLSGIASEGMRYRVTRGTTPPTQCADLEQASSQYFINSSTTGISPTTTVSVEATVKPESFPSTRNSIFSTRTGTNGIHLRINSSGQIEFLLLQDGSNFRTLSSYQSIPFNKWSHISVNLSISTGSGDIYLDGVAIPSTVSTTGSPSTITNTTTVSVGASIGSDFWDGKISNVLVWSDERTATEVRDNQFNYPADTTGLIGHWKLNGDATDSSSNGNDLTAQNSAVATNADNPWNATEYGVITAVTSSTIQVFCPEGYGIPNETLTSPFYSTQDTPFGFPRDKGKWSVTTQVNTDLEVTPAAANDWKSTGATLTVPVGKWKISFEGNIKQDNTVAGINSPKIALSTSSSSVSDYTLQRSPLGRVSTTSFESYAINLSGYIDITSSTPYFTIMTYTVGDNVVSILASTTYGYATVKAECAYI